MAQRIRTHIRSNIVGYVAVFLALTGGAYAVTTAPKNSVVSSSIKDGEVRPADIAAGAISTPKFNPTAIAPNAAKLGGRGPGVYQRRVLGSCVEENAGIAGISAEGAVECGPRIVPIKGVGAGGSGNELLATLPNLEIRQACNAPGSAIFFINKTSSAATLNWMFSQGGTTSTVNASGDVIAAGDDLPFVYGNRLEGQWIFSGAGITTVSLHAFDAGNDCEVRGTAVYAETN